MGFDGRIERVNLKSFLSGTHIANLKSYAPTGSAKIAEKTQRFLDKIIKERKISRGDWSELTSDLHYIDRLIPKGSGIWIRGIKEIDIDRQDYAQHYLAFIVPELLKSVSKEAHDVWNKLFSLEGKREEKIKINNIEYSLESYESGAVSSGFIIKREITILKDVLEKILENKPKFEKTVTNAANKFAEGDNKLAEEYIADFKKKMYLELIYLMLEFSTDDDVIVGYRAY